MAKTTQRSENHEPPPIHLQPHQPETTRGPLGPIRTDSGTLASHWLGPLFLKIGGRVVYRVEDILAYEVAAPGRFDPIAGVQQIDANLIIDSFSPQ